MNTPITVRLTASEILLSNEPGTERSDIKEALVAWHKMRRSEPA